MRRWTLAPVGLGLFLLFLVASCSGPSSSSPSLPLVAASEVRSLFDAVRADKPNIPPGVEALVSGGRKVARDDPSWPTVTFLVGEIERRRGHTQRARTAFSELATWAASDPGAYGDTWGGSGLGVAGLWRWLQILDEHGFTTEEAERALDVAAKLQNTRLYSGMVRSKLLPGLPLMAEEVADRLAHIAWKNNKPDLARTLYLDFLAIDSRGKLDDIDRKIREQLLREGLATPERLDLFRARRQLALVTTESQKNEAARSLKKLWDNRQAPDDVRAEAGYEWANYIRKETPELITVLNEVIAMAGDAPVVAKALYRRGILQSGDARVVSMLELQRRFPDSPLADDALFQVATEYLFRPDLDQALYYYKALRDFKGSNDFVDTAYYMPAMGLVGRGGGKDLNAADQLLVAYLTQHPNGAFRLRSLFWRGRIAEQKNDVAKAREFFQKVIEEAPYDYFGLRSRLHLDEGIKAISQTVPATGSRTWTGFNQAYRKSRADPVLSGRSPYHERLKAAADTGIYKKLLETELDTQKQFGRRLDDISLADLDKRGWTPSIVLLLSLRQDALAARDHDPGASNCLQLGGLLGHKLKDWPVAIDVTFVPDEEHERLEAIQNDPRYLATAYPNPSDLPLLRESLAGAAWADAHGSMHLSQGLMYALIRNESRFYSRAISPKGAVGLLQMMPDTFKSIDKQSRLLEKSGIASEVEYLFDPQRNIATWAGWWPAEFGKDDLILGVMKHNAGATSVSNLLNTYWAQMGSKDDLEYRVETVRIRETRNFVRTVLQDTMIVDAAGFFEGH